MISYEEIQELTQDYQDELNIPPNVDSSVFAMYKEMIKKIGEGAEFLPSVIFGPTGNIVWEEPEEEYLARMGKLYHEVK